MMHPYDCHPDARTLQLFGARGRCMKTFYFLSAATVLIQSQTDSTQALCTQRLLIMTRYKHFSKDS